MLTMTSSCLIRALETNFSKLIWQTVPKSICFGLRKSALKRFQSWNVLVFESPLSNYSKVEMVWALNIHVQTFPMWLCFGLSNSEVKRLQNKYEPGQVKLFRALKLCFQRVRVDMLCGLKTRFQTFHKSKCFGALNPAFKRCQSWNLLVL